ncbi:MAG TPA: SRPBCC family protein [Candidatus Limnocylindrales bacterium]|nr:SRPBCC family protein [Candidatus Limnocylindrales bacterium]
MRSTIAIDIAADPELVFSLARDATRWPRLLPHYVAATPLGARDAEGRLEVRFIARRSLVPVLGLGLPVAWRSATWADPETLRLRFVHRGGATNGMDVTWRIIRIAGGPTHVDIEHVFTPRVPGWAWLIDRLFTRPIAGRTLATFRDLAEAVSTLTPAAAGAPASAEAQIANLPT